MSWADSIIDNSAQAFKTLFMKEFVVSIAFIFILVLNSNQAQEFLESKNMIGLQVGMGVTPALSITPVLWPNQDPISESRVSSSQSYFFQTDLTYSRRVLGNLFGQMGLIYGFEAYNFQLNADPDFISTDRDIFPLRITESDLEYRGLSLKLNYYFAFKDHSGIFARAGISRVKYFRNKSGSLFRTMVNGEDKVIFYSPQRINADKNNFFNRIDMELGYYHQFTNNFIIKGSISYSFSNRSIIDHFWGYNYTFIGDNDFERGLVERKTRQTGLNLGLYYIL
ncbi:MAG: hypothetical protein EA362_00010 [Saprospirales bacterium]|nr:MAG: hypothetical protein EA362_00010 [Saprospirales bacterium]